MDIKVLEPQLPLWATAAYRAPRSQDPASSVQSEESPGFVSSHSPMSAQCALSRVVASRAAQFELVQSLRTDVLQNQLVPFAELSDWIDRQALDEQPAYFAWASSQENPSPECICWVPRVGNWIKRRPVVPNGVLDRVRLGAQALAKSLLWSEAQAVVFLLSGEIPIVLPCTLSTTIGSLPALSRVTMDIHLSLSPSDVRALYQRVQRTLLGERKRQRNMTPKHLTLAAFAAENKSGRTYGQLRRLWNQKHPRWKYLGSDEHFGKDCKRAQDKLLLKGLTLRSSFNLGRL